MFFPHRSGTSARLVQRYASISGTSCVWGAATGLPTAVGPGARDAQVRGLVGDDALDHALLAGVLAGQDEDGVALADLGDARSTGCHHSTSGASDTIFM